MTCFCHLSMVIEIIFYQLLLEVRWENVSIFYLIDIHKYLNFINVNGKIFRIFSYSKMST